MGASPLNKVYPLDVSAGYPRGPAPPPSANAEGEGVISVQRVIRAVRRRLNLMIAVFLLVFAAVAVFTYQIKPSYTATSRVIINTRDQNIIDIGAVLSGMGANTTLVDTEAEILRSRSLIGKVVTRLDLVNNPEFNGAKAQPSEMDKRISAIKAFIKSLTPFGKGKKADAESAPPVDPAEAAKSELDGVVGAVRGAVGVNRVGSTYIIEIRATSRDPKMAALLANTLADVYIDNQLDTKFDATRRASDWLNTRVAELQEEVRAADNAVEQHRARAGLFSTEGSTLIEQNVRDLNNQLSIAQAEYNVKSSRLRNLNSQIQANRGVDTITEALNSQNIMSLRQKQADIAVRKADAERKYLPGYPEYQKVQVEWADNERQLKAELNRLVSSVEQEVLIAKERLSSTQASLNREKSILAGANSAGVEQAALEREAEASRGLLETFNKRLKETEEVEKITDSDATIDSYAPVPGSPSFPNTKLNLALGIMLGLALAGFAGLATELLDSYLSSPEEVEAVAGVPYIGQIPLLPAAGNFTKARVKPAEYLIDKPHSGFAEAYRHLRASIMFADIDKAAKTVAVVSSLPSEGKTSMTFCLGRMAAMSGTKTIVIDGDIRLRQLTEISGVKAEAGLLEYLFGEARLAEAVHTDEKTGLHVLPLTDRKHTPRDVFGSRAFDALLNLLQQTYDLIIIDTGPILLMAETRVVTSKVDQVVVATRWRKTNRGTLRETMKILRDFNANVAGVVLTFVDLRKRSHHAYTSADYKAYSKYYHEG
jgi:polysaccharide biosynthesis transport protein